MALNSELKILLKSLQDAGVSTADYEKELRKASITQAEITKLTLQMKEALDASDNSASGLFSEMQAIVGELGRSNQYLTRTKGLYNKVTDIARKLRDDEQGIADLNKNQLKVLVRKAKSNQDYLKNTEKGVRKELSDYKKANKVTSKGYDNKVAQYEAAIKMAEDEGDQVARTVQAVKQS